MTLTQQQLVKVEVEVCQTLLTWLRVQDFPAYVFYLTLPINPVIIELILFCKKTYSSLANNLTLGRAKWQKGDHFFFYLVFSQWNSSSDEFDRQIRFLDRQISSALLYWIHSCYVRKNPKHCTYCKKSVGFFKRQCLTGSSFYTFWCFWIASWLWEVVTYNVQELVSHGTYH